MATTRIETMLGDTAVAVHPNDSRYQVMPNFPFLNAWFVSVYDRGKLTGTLNSVPSSISKARWLFIRSVTGRCRWCLMILWI